MNQSVNSNCTTKSRVPCSRAREFILSEDTKLASNLCRVYRLSIYACLITCSTLDCSRLVIVIIIAFVVCNLCFYFPSSDKNTFARGHHTFASEYRRIFFCATRTTLNLSTWALANIFTRISSAHKFIHTSLNRQILCFVHLHFTIFKFRVMPSHLCEPVANTGSLQ